MCASVPVCFQEEGVGTLGLSTGQALGTLRDQLTTLLDQHQTTGRGKQPTAQVDTTAHTHIHTH